MKVMAANGAALSPTLTGICRWSGGVQQHLHWFICMPNKITAKQKRTMHWSYTTAVSVLILSGMRSTQRRYVSTRKSISQWVQMFVFMLFGQQTKHIVRRYSAFYYRHI